MLARQYVHWLGEHISLQEEAAEYAEFLVARAVCETVTSAGRIQYFVRRFGSRAHGVYCLPSSDLDLVCELDPAIWEPGFTRKNILEKVLDSLKQDGRLSAVKNVIKYKNTIEFTLAELRVDFTIHVREAGDLHSMHSPSRVTDTVGGLICAFSHTAQKVAMLAVDWAKRAHVCWDRKGAIHDGLKAIHWTLLAIAWYHFSRRYEEDSSGEADDPFSEILLELFEFYADFEFRSSRISALDLQPFRESSAPAPERPVMWLSCPLDADRNLAEYVTEDTVSHIRQALKEAQGHLSTSREGFWMAARQRWQPYWNRRYAFDRRTLNEAVIETIGHHPATSRTC